MAEKVNQFGMTDEDTRKRIKTLKASYQMYEKSLKETELELKHKTDKDGHKLYTKEKIEETLSSIREAQNSVVEEYLMLGGKESELGRKYKPYVSTGKEFKMMEMPNIPDEPEKETTNVMDKLKQMTNPVKEVTVKEPKTKAVTTKKSNNEAPKEKNTDSSKNILEKVTDVNVQYVNYEHANGFDLIPLPSKGECYKNKIDKIAVAPLCGYDEDMIMAPNLYSDKLILDMLLKSKIIDKTIDPMNLLDGDREAILLWLRAEGYGNDFSVSARDHNTGKSFESNVDLSKLKYKNFTLKSDENGWFDYKLPRSGSLVKFKFLNHRETLSLQKLDEFEAKTTMKSRLANFVATMDNFVEASEDMDSDYQSSVRKAIRTIEKWGDSIDDENSTDYTHQITNTIEMEIMAIDGNTDRDFIHEFVQNMSIKDSSSLRQYIAKNEPGVDYHFTVEKPESLGGGSQEVFLRFDEYIFLNNK